MKEFMLTTYEEVKAFADEHARTGFGGEEYRILPDLSVLVTGCHLTFGDDYAPYAGKFAYEVVPVVLVGVPDTLRILDCSSLRNLHNLPTRVRRSCYLSNCGALETLEGGPEEAGDFRLEDCPLLNNLEHLPRVPVGGFLELRLRPGNSLRAEHLPSSFGAEPGDFFCYWGLGGGLVVYGQFLREVQDFQDCLRSPEDLPLLAARGEDSLAGWLAGNALRYPCADPQP
jgi:hypothetical protein